jgi:hypothetical protein
MSVTPTPGLVAQVATGGQSVTVFPGGITGGFIVNPSGATDQGISVPEVLYVDPTGNAAVLQANGTCFALFPGQSWQAIPEQATSTAVNAQTSGHKFSAVMW